MTFVDVMVVGVLAAGLLVGCLRGFLTQFTGVAGILAGLYLADRHANAVDEHVVARVLDSRHSTAFAFLLIVLACLVVTGLLVWCVRRVVANFELGAYDRLMGGLLGFFKAGLLSAGVLLVLVTFTPGDGSIARAIGESRSGPILWQGMDRAARLLPGEYAERVGDYLQRNRPPVRPRQSANAVE